MNASKKLGKIVLPIITPFDRKTGDINYPVLKDLIEHVISNNYCDSIAVCGTTGEFNTLSYDERVEMFRFVKEQVNGRVMLMAGTGAASTREAIALTQAAEKLGYEIAMVVAPYYCKPNQEGIYNHFKAIAECTKMDIMLYNIPIFTGVNMDPATVGRLAKIKNVVGIKDEAGLNPTQMTDYTHVTPKDFTIYNGDDIMILCGLSQGAAGVVSGASHLIGGKIRKMIDLFLAGKVSEAREIHMEIDPFFKAFCPNGRVHPMPVLRAAVEIMGIPIGPARMPLDEATAEEKEAIKKHLVRLGVVR